MRRHQTLDTLHVMEYNKYMTYSTLRIWESTLKKLRRIYAETGESMISVVDRLATQELEKLTNENAKVQTLQVEKE